MSRGPGRLFVVLPAVFAALVTAPDSALCAERRALLVGCSAYPALDARLQLDGPANDVEIMRDLLTSDRFGFSPDQITVLSERQKDRTLLPTRANIEREFAALARGASPGDQTVILLAGHGSQQPADEDPDDPEPDGLDEIFLPSDIGRWDGAEGKVRNAIVDDELRAWLSAISAKGAFVWLIVDACHSGTLMRGSPRERQRRVDARELCPPEVLAEASARATSVGRSSGALPAEVGVAPHGGLVVALYAAQSTETTPEKPLPRNGQPKRPHGVFTYTLNEVLAQSEGSLTYRELAERITARYRSRQRWSPTPLIEGGGLDREVLGLREWPDRPNVLLSMDRDGRLTVGSGALHGLEPGTILAVYPPAGQRNAGRPVGHVKVSEVGPVSSVVVPVAFGDLAAPAAERLIPGCRCRAVFVDLGEQRLAVAVQAQLPGTDASSPALVTYAPGEGPAAVEAAMAWIERERGGLAARVGDPADADWFVRLTGDGSSVCLVPSAGWSGAGAAGAGPGDSRTALPPPEFLTGELGEIEATAARISDALSRIARARHLMAIAAAGSGPYTQWSVSVEVAVLRHSGLTDVDPVPVRYGPNGRILREGDLVSFRVTNRTPGRSIDATLLFVDSGCGVSALFPAPGTAGDNRIAPGDYAETRPVRVTADTVGPEHIVAIAVAAGRDPVDFTCLEQPTLERSRAAGGVRALDSPLGRLLESAMYGVGSSRGLKSTEFGSYGIQMLSWTTLPADDGRAFRQ